MNVKNIKYENLQILINKGVTIPNPGSVFIDEDVDLDRISSDGVVLHSGTKLSGKRTLIMKNTVLGWEAPVTAENCLIGPDTKLLGGYFQDTVFMGNNVFGSNGHVRKGCILEEQANAAHTVGLKQTILFPFVTLGSLINFCDCLMAGGTSRQDHSEVGSSFIHFNYTPNQDKATASMMGNVHQGVMLNQRPVFLGGQGGLVGPLRIAFGCITAAGSIIRRSELRSNRLIMGGSLKNASIGWAPGIYTRPDNIFKENLYYIAGLFALKAWYLTIRPVFISDFLSEQLVAGLQENIDICIQERIKRLNDFGRKLEVSCQMLKEKNEGQTGTPAIAGHEKVLGWIAGIKGPFDKVDTNIKSFDPTADPFVQQVEKMADKTGKDYVATIQRLDEATADMGTSWLKQIEDSITGLFAFDS